MTANRPHTALIIDDQPHMRAVLARMVEGAGLSCTLAASAAEAVQLLDGEPFDIAFVDIRLEDGDGLDVASRIRARFADTAVVMVTGVDDVNAVITAMQLGAVDYVLKPCTFEDISRAVRSALRFVTQRRALRRLPQLEIEVQNRAHEVMALTGELDSTLEGSVGALVAAMEQRDIALARHSKRVAEVSTTLAAALGLSREDRALTERAALVHDVGKWCLPEALLHKPGPLTDEEWVVVRRHAEVGYEILRRIPGMGPVAEVVWSHQERHDGSGYPRGLKHDAIPLPARIIAVADAIDAMTSDRPYRPARTMGQAVTEAERCSGSQFDPLVVRALRSAMVRTA